MTILIVVVSITQSLTISQAHAQEIIQQCGDAYTQYVAFVSIPNDTDSMYVKASRPEDTGNAKIYFQTADDSTTSQCQLLGESQLRTDSWSTIGFDKLGGQVSGSLILALDGVQTTEPGANSPHIVFANEESPCTFSPTCSVNYDGELFELTPQRISLHFDTLRVSVLRPLSDNPPVKVIYSIDGRKVYERSEFEPFNMNYVPGGEHELTRTILQDNGQSLSTSDTVENGTIGDLGYYVNATYNTYSKLIWYVLFIFSLVVFIYIAQTLRILVLNRYRERRFRSASKRGAISKQTGALPDEKISEILLFSTIQSRRKTLLVGLIVFSIIYAAYGSVISVFTVDGVSMEPTLQNGSKRPLFNLPVTASKYTGYGFIPNRGTIVVVNQNENAAYGLDISNDTSYVVKRVLALPGERVVLTDGKIQVFTQAEKTGFIPDDEFGWITDTTGSENLQIDITLSDNQLFIVGDNRDESIDSRYYGPISIDQLVGTVL